MVEAKVLTDILQAHETKVTELLVESSCEELLNENYYKNQLLPNLKKISSNAKELEKNSEFLTSLIERIVTKDNQFTRDISELVPHFVEQYFDFLHTEPQNIVTKVADLEATLEKVYFDDDSSLRLNEELIVLIKNLKSSDLNKYLTDILDIATNIYHETDVKDYLNKAPNILKELETEKLNINNYLDLSKKISKHHEDYFLLSQQEIVKKLKILEKTEKYKDILREHYIANVGYFHQFRIDDEFEFRKLSARLNELKETNSEKEIFKMYYDSIRLGNEGIDGKKFIEEINSRIIKEHQDEIVDCAISLKNNSSRLSNAFLSNAEDIFLLPERKRKKALLVGKYLSKKTDVPMLAYFETAHYVLYKGEEEFAKWIRRFNEFAKATSFESNVHLNEYLRLSQLLLYEDSDKILECYLKLNEEFNSESNSNIKTILERKTALDILFSDIELMVTNGLYLHVYTDRMIKALNLSSPSQEKNLTYFEFEEYYQHSKNLEGKNIVENNYWEILPSIFKNNLYELSLENLEELINSDLSLTEKNKLLQEYGSMYKLFDSEPKLDLKSEWKLEYTKSAINKIAKECKITKDLSNLSMEQIIAFNQILKAEEVDKLNLKVVIEKTIANKTFSKIFKLGKTYGQASVSGLCKLDDPLTLTENLVYGLISRDDEKRKGAEQYFEPNKLESAREFINPRELFKLIKNDLPKLQEGSRTSAENILNTIYSKYKNKECVSDMVVKVQSLFAEDERIDGLEIKMQEGTYKDLFDNRETLCCSFYPTGENAHASFNYLLDDNIGLLHILPRNGEKTSNPIGVAILVNTYNPETKEKYLLIDSVEAGAKIDKIRKSIWMPLLKDSIYKLAKDMNYDKIIYNSEVGNSKSESFINYLVNNTEKENITVKLYKKQSEHSQIIKNARKQLKQLKEIKNSKSLIYDGDLDRHIRNNFSPYLESFEFNYSYSLSLQKSDFGGNVEGIVFDVK